MLNLGFYLPYKTSPRRCSQGSPGGWILISFLQIRNRILLEDSLKNYDDFCYIKFQFQCSLSNFT